MKPKSIKWFHSVWTALAVVLLTGAAPVRATEVLTFIHTDVAGSPVAATDINGNVIWREGYRPYGARTKNESAAADNRQFFHGKAFDADSGLSYFGARYYDPFIGRFMGVDAVGFNEDNIHSFNRYAYGNNNPYRFLDPDGSSPLSVLLYYTGGGYAAGIVADSISQYVAFGHVDWSLAATSNAAAGGGAAGLLSGFGVGTAVRAKTLIQTTEGASGAANRALHEAYKDGLRAVMEKPAVSDKTLSTIVENLYRPNATVGSGSTAAAVRQELANGQPVGGAFHSQKARDGIVELQRWLGKNPTAGSGDRAAAENIIRDMRNALSGQ